MDDYDVIILGGGLAGLTLGLQLKGARPETSVLIAEERRGPAPEAAFKVGESTVEISSNYFGHVVGMQDHLESDQLPKAGLRFWFPAGDNSDISQRIEYGVPFFPPVPSFQLDRGRFENELARRVRDAGVDLRDGCAATDIEIGSDGHSVTLERDGERSNASGRWLVDATGRAFTLKRKLGLLEDNGHKVNSSWFRLADGLDLEAWVDEGDSEWFGRMTERGIRRMSTNHLCGEGYWVWLIPLASGPISIGIVADDRLHPFDRINTLDGTLEWLREHEPQLARELDGRRDQVEDFLRVGDFSYGCERVYSPERWCLTGEAGPFLDPFYSPGSDFIAMGNSFITDLVTRELGGEDVSGRVEAHNELFLRAYEASLVMYEGQYVFWGNPQVMSMKITTNNIVYWSALALLFFNRKLTDPEFMASVRPDVERLWRVNARLEALYRDWHALENREWRRGHVPGLQFSGYGQRHLDLHQSFDDDGLRARIAEDADLMEAVAVVVFHRAAKTLDTPPPDEDVAIDPYAIGMQPERWEADGLVSDSGLSLAAARERTPGLETLWMEEFAQPVEQPT